MCVCATNLWLAKESHITRADGVLVEGTKQNEQAKYSTTNELNLEHVQTQRFRRFIQFHTIGIPFARPTTHGTPTKALNFNLQQLVSIVNSYVIDVQYVSSK